MPSLTHQQVAARYQFAGLDIPTQLKTWATQTPDRTCMIWHPFSGAPQRWSYAGFWQSVQELAAGLHRRGIRHGDKVVLHCDNCPEITSHPPIASNAVLASVCSNSMKRFAVSAL